MNTHRLFQHAFLHGYLSVTIPEKLSVEELQDIKDHFALIVKQAERRAYKEIEDANG